jgi:uncharacterized protein YndB with AHSA1/START domain
VLTRTFDAPREVVFQAWIDPKQLAEWWGPKGFTNPVCEFDPNPGGAIRIDMTAPDGTVYPMGGTVREIVPPERLVFSATAYDGALETLNTVTFIDDHGGTKLTVRASVVKSSPKTADAIAGMEQGWSESLDRLADLVPVIDASDREIAASRLFEAPRQLVWKMWTDPHHVAQWWGPRGFTNTIHEMNVSPGGHWRFHMHGPDGRNYRNEIIYREIVEPERLVYDHVSEPFFNVVVTFAEENGKTRVTMRSLFKSAEIRRKVVETFGAIEGMKQTLARLGEQLAHRSFVITRTLDAPRELVFKVWTDGEHLKNWFGPKGATIISSKNDFRPGGMYHYGMTTPDGTELWGRWVYREIDPPNKFVFVNSFSDPEGGLAGAPFPGDWPREMLSTITFIEFEGKTTVTIEWAPLNATEREAEFFQSMHESMNQGWGGTLDQLADYVGQPLRLSGVIDANR